MHSLTFISRGVGSDPQLAGLTHSSEALLARGARCLRGAAADLAVTATGAVASSACSEEPAFFTTARLADVRRGG